MSNWSYYCAALPRAFEQGWEWAENQGIWLTLWLAISTFVFEGLVLAVYSRRTTELMSAWRSVKGAVVKGVTALIGGVTLLLVGLFVTFFVQDAPSQNRALNARITALTKENGQLHQRLQDRSDKRVSLDIGGAIIGGVNFDSTRVQLTITAYNAGEPTTLHQWGMVIETSGRRFEAIHMFGDQLVKGSLDLPRLDTRLQEPINQGVEIPGLISFIIHDVQPAAINALYADSSALIVVTALDSFGQKVTGTQSIAKLFAQRHEVKQAQ